MKSSNAHCALVTGGSRGIGAEIVKCLELGGVRVLAPARVSLDLADPQSVRRYAADSLDPAIDILVNNAGINTLATLEELPEASWHEMLQVDLHAPLALLQGVAPLMKRRGWGRIVNISSIFGIVTKERRGAYSMVKSALNGLTRSAAVELGPHGILVNSVCPGFIDTALTRQNNSPADLAQLEAVIPLGRLARAEEIARCVAFLCSEENTYLTGQSLIVDGGYTCR